jgi:hypothetical protein
VAKYAEMTKVDAGLKFKTPSGVLVETTGSTQHIASHNLYVHEVVVAEGSGQGQKFLLNLDYAQAR